MRVRVAALAYDKKYVVPKGRNAVWRNRDLFAQVFGYAMPETQVFGLSVPEASRLKNLAQPYYAALHATSRDSKLYYGKLAGVAAETESKTTMQCLSALGKRG